MARRSDYRNWLRPDARQEDGCLWPSKLAKATGPTNRKRSPIPVAKVRRQRRSVHPFTSREHRLLRDKLLEVELAPEGLAAGFRPVRWARQHKDDLDVRRLTPQLRELVDRGLLRLAMTVSGPRCVFTDAGVAGLRAFFMSQPRDFRSLFPRLHRELALSELLDPRSSRR